MQFHTICGLPRSGSTLLCNLLNQNPQFRASSTSALASTVSALGHLWSRSPEVKSDLINDKDATEERMTRCLRAMCEQWYGDFDGFVFDKSRHWNHSALILHRLFPQAKMFVLVRDLRDIFASIEKRHQEEPYLDEINNPTERTTFARADRMFAPNGLIGLPVNGVEDLVRRNLPFVRLIQFETFCSAPQLVLERIYAALGIDKMYDHDLENVENVADDVDGLYLNKFPHQGEGAVKPPEQRWQDFVSADIAQLIMGKFVHYNRALGYQ